jgi:hypothetical protein
VAGVMGCEHLKTEGLDKDGGLFAGLFCTNIKHPEDKQSNDKYLPRCNSDDEETCEWR